MAMKRKLNLHIIKPQLKKRYSLFSKKKWREIKVECRSYQMISKQIKVKKAQPPRDIPSRILKDFAVHISKPIANIFNTSISQGMWPEVWKQEVVTPVAKVFPPALMKNLGSISGLPTLDKILERLISDLIIPDMKKHADEHIKI